jgi:hypothetical protein
MQRALLPPFALRNPDALISILHPRRISDETATDVFAELPVAHTPYTFPPALVHVAVNISERKVLVKMFSPDTAISA